MITLILIGIRSGCCSEQGDSKDIALTGKTVLGLGQDSNTVSILAEVRILTEKINTWKHSDRGGVLCDHKLRIWLRRGWCSCMWDVAQSQIDTRTLRMYC